MLGGHAPHVARGVGVGVGVKGVLWEWGQRGGSWLSCLAFWQAAFWASPFSFHWGLLPPLWGQGWLEGGHPRSKIHFRSGGDGLVVVHIFTLFNHGGGQVHLLNHSFLSTWLA